MSYIKKMHNIKHYIHTHKHDLAEYTNYFLIFPNVTNAPNSISAFFFNKLWRLPKNQPNNNLKSLKKI